MAVDTARRVNDFLAAEVADSGGRLADFATVAPQDVAAAVKELTRAVTELGFCGAMVNGYSDLGADKLYLDEDRFEPFWTALEELQVSLYLHPRLPSHAVQDAIYRGHPELVGATWGFAPETVTHVLHVVFCGSGPADGSPSCACRERRSRRRRRTRPTRRLPRPRS
jgi:predicted TIM-barrel fold metal-dependent hydrolase